MCLKCVKGRQLPHYATAQEKKKDCFKLPIASGLERNIPHNKQEFTVFPDLKNGSGQTANELLSLAQLGDDAQDPLHRVCIAHGLCVARVWLLLLLLLLEQKYGGNILIDDIVAVQTVRAED